MTPLDTLVPMPRQVRRLPGAYEIGAGGGIGADAQARESAWLLHDVLAGGGVRAPVLAAGDGPAAVVLRVDGAAGADPEAYTVTVTAGGVEMVGASAAAAARAAELGLASVDLLQSWFMRELHGYLSGRGRRVVGWDEVLADGGMPADTAVMPWRDARYGVEAMRAGHDVVMCPRTACYFDHYQSPDSDEPVACEELTTVADVAGWEPEPGGAGGLPGRVLGVQGQLWTEHMPAPRDVEYMAFPRLCALAEAGWTAPPRRSPAGLLDRLGGHLRRLDALGVNYRPLDGPLPWQRGGRGPRRRPATRQGAM